MSAQWLLLSLAWLLTWLRVCALPCNFTNTDAALQHCQQYDDLYEAIHQDLSLWAETGGISMSLMQQAAKQYTTLEQHKGVMLGFYKGKAYVIEATLSSSLWHHANVMFTYMHVMLELEQLFGSAIPDVEFVIATSDRPMVLKPAIAQQVAEQVQRSREAKAALRKHSVKRSLPVSNTTPTSSQKSQQQQQQQAEGATGSARHTHQHHRHHSQTVKQHDEPVHTRGQKGDMTEQQQEQQQREQEQQQDPGVSKHSRQLQASKRPAPAPIAEQQPVPVFRFCNSPGHADIRQPIFHFYTKKYSQRLLAHIPKVMAMHPWQGREEMLFGRFSHYHRLVHPLVPETRREGANGSNICTLDSTHTLSCRVRQHLFEVAALYPERMDIKSGPKMAMLDQARYKWLVHVDGQALSSRTDQLLALGSLVFKENSGYYTYYEHLLKPWQHYIPYWDTSPLELLQRLDWAQSHDAEAEAIAQAGQAFAVKYLNKRARTCYWYKLVSEFAALLTYKPEPGAGALSKAWVPIQEYFDTTASVFEGGKWFAPQIEQ